MLVPEVEVGSSEVPEEVGEEVPLSCSCSRVQDDMNATLMTVLCEGNVTCTLLNSQPGATIVSPILLSLSGVTGQIWALYYLYTSTRPQHSRTVFFVLLSTLIWTDLFGKVITTAPALAAYVKGSWVGGVSLCNFHGFSMMLISLVTHLLVSTMAIERFLGIRHGYYYNKNITPSRTKLLLLGIWLFSVLFCAMPLFGFGQYGLQYPGSWCYVNIHVTSSSPLHARIYTNIFGVFTLINLIVMVFCNVVVITTLLCLRLCRQRCLGSNSFTAPQRSYRQRELELQMVIVLLVITIVFIISWSPIDMRLFLNQLWPHRTQADHIQDLIAVRLTSINQIIDPWAYIICRKVFSTRAWRWMRLSLMGSKLLARESSSHPPGGSNKKPSQKNKPPEKIQYKTHFNGEAALDLSKEVVVVVSPPVPLASKDSLSKEQESNKVEETKDGVEGQNIVEVFKGSSEAPSSGCSHSETTAKCNPSFHGDGRDLATLSVVPIPVFTSQQYRVCPLEERLHTLRLTSSASARASRTTKQAQDLCETSSGMWVSASAVLGRRHSWSCDQDNLDDKQLRTQSTQTIRLLADDTARLACHHHHHHNHHRKLQNDHNHHSNYDSYGSYHQQNDHTAHKERNIDDSRLHHNHTPYPLHNHTTYYHGERGLYHCGHTHEGGGHLYSNEYSTDPNDDSVFIIDNEVSRWRDNPESSENKSNKSNSLFSCIRRSGTSTDQDLTDLC